MQQKPPKPDDDGLIIDVEATAVPNDTNPQADAKPAFGSTHDDSSPHHRSFTSLLVSEHPYGWLAGLFLLTIGVLGGVLLYTQVLSDYFAKPQQSDVQQHITGLESRLAALGTQVESLSLANQTLQKQLASTEQTLTERLTSQSAAVDTATGHVEELRTSLSAVQAQVAELDPAATTTRNEIAALKTTVGQLAADALTNPWNAQTRAQMENRLNSAEKNIAALQQATTPKAENPMRAALQDSLGALKSKVAAGLAYQADYERLMQILPAAAGLGTLGVTAEKGLPNAQGLSNLLLADVPKLAPATPAETGGIGDYIGLNKLITIRRAGEVNWQAAATEAAGLARANQLQQAIELLNKAGEARPAQITQWLTLAQARMAQEQALGETEAAVTRQLASMGQTP